MYVACYVCTLRKAIHDMSQMAVYVDSLLRAV